MESPTGVIPEELMYPQKKREVMAFLKAAPLPAELKRNLLLGWAVTVGMRLSSRERREVERTGVDASYTGSGTYVQP